MPFLHVNKIFFISFHPFEAIKVSWAWGSLHVGSRRGSPPKGTCQPCPAPAAPAASEDFCWLCARWCWAHRPSWQEGRVTTCYLPCGSFNVVITVGNAFPALAESPHCQSVHRFYSAYHGHFSPMEPIPFHCPEFWVGLLLLFPPLFCKGFKAKLSSLSPPPVSFTKNSYKSQSTDLAVNLSGCLSSLKSLVLLRRQVSPIL